jgi:hypothetical protein
MAACPFGKLVVKGVPVAGWLAALAWRHGDEKAVRGSNGHYGA